MTMSHFLQIPILLRLRLDRRAEGALPPRGARDGTLRRARLRRPCVRRGRRCVATPGARAPSCTHQRRLTPACSPSRRVLPRRRRAGAPRLSGRPPASRQSAWGAPGAGGARAARALRRCPYFLDIFWRRARECCTECKRPMASGFLYGDDAAEFMRQRGVQTWEAANEAGGCAAEWWDECARCDDGSGLRVLWPPPTRHVATSATTRE